MVFYAIRYIVDLEFKLLTKGYKAQRLHSVKHFFFSMKFAFIVLEKFYEMLSLLSQSRFFIDKII